jgi:hypothetical protein
MLILTLVSMGIGTAVILLLPTGASIGMRRLLWARLA